MPAPKMYVGSAEVSALLGISRREAQYILKMFELRGQVIKIGKANRVALKVLAAYLSDQDGTSPADTFETLKAALKTA